MALRAQLDGVLLIEGDPSDPRLLERLSARKARRAFVSHPDDLQAIDIAVALRAHRPEGGDIRVVLNDSAVAGNMAEAVALGFLGASNVSWFSVADETARLPDRRRTI